MCMRSRVERLVLRQEGHRMLHSTKETYRATTPKSKAHGICARPDSACGNGIESALKGTEIEVMHTARALLPTDSYHFVSSFSHKSVNLGLSPLLILYAIMSLFRPYIPLLYVPLKPWIMVNTYWKINICFVEKKQSTCLVTLVG